MNTITPTRYGTLALTYLPRGELTPVGPATYAAAGLASAYGRTLPTYALAENYVNGVRRSFTAYAVTTGGYVNPAAAYPTYVTVVPGSVPVSLTLTARVRRVGKYRLLTGYVSGSGGLGNTPPVAVLTASRLPYLRRSRGSVVTLLPDPALGAGYVLVA